MSIATTPVIDPAGGIPNVTESWIISFPCNRAEAERMTGEVAELADFDPAPVLVAVEEDEDADRWRLDCYFEEKPPRAAVIVVARALGRANRDLPKPHRIDDQDWVTLSQSGLEPVRAGRFYVHTANDEPDARRGIVNLRIDAGQAFGTGHHQTTAGCLAILDRLQERGRRYRNVIDVGTGTGLLAFAALHLWPRATVLASDIDPVSVRVTAENAAVNGVPLGWRRGQLMLLVADGVNDAVIAQSTPFDLVIANILAGPLIALAPALANVTAPGGTLILAGLLNRQRSAVVRAYTRVGFRLDDDGGNAEWPALRLTMRQRYGWRRPIRATGGAGQPPGDFGSW